jgi:hypothetical protein
MKVSLSNVTLNATLKDSDTYGKHAVLEGSGERQFMKGYGYKVKVTLEDGSSMYVRILDFAAIKEGGGEVRKVDVKEAAKTAAAPKVKKLKVDKTSESAPLAPSVEVSAELQEYRDFLAFKAMKAQAAQAK